MGPLGGVGGRVARSYNGAVSLLESFGGVDVRFMPPYRAVKEYLCPNCDRAIPASTGHYVVVPAEAPDLRRHWHRGCWDGRATRGAPRR